MKRLIIVMASVSGFFILTVFVEGSIAPVLCEYFKDSHSKGCYATEIACVFTMLPVVVAFLFSSRLRNTIPIHFRWSWTLLIPIAPVLNRGENGRETVTTLKQPIFSKRSFDTSITIKSGTTVLLGGIIRQEDVNRGGRVETRRINQIFLISAEILPTQSPP